jgi:AraC family chitin signaling transcriptional activator
MYKFIRLLFFLSYFCFLFTINSQSVNSEYIFKHYTVEDGLISNLINDMGVDKNGFIWIATQSGISRFDGRYFLNFNSFNHKDIKNNRFFLMIRENDSNLYFYNTLYQQFKVNENSELIEIKDWNKNNAYITVFNNLNIKKEGNYNVGKDYFYDIFDIKNTDIFKATEKDFYKIISETEIKGLYYNETKISDYDDNAIQRKFLVEGRLCLLGKNKIISVYNKGKLERKYDLEKELNQTIEIEKVFVNQNRKKSTLCYKVQIFDIDFINGQLKFTKNNFEIDYDRGLAKLEFNNKSNKTFIYTNANGFYVYFKSNFINCTDCYQSSVHKFVNRVIKHQSNLVKYDYFKKINTKYNISHLDLFFNISEDTVCFIKGNQIVYAANNSEQKYTLQLKDFNQTNGNFSDALVFGKNVYLIRKNCLYELLGKNKLELKAELSKENLVTATRVKNENEWLLYYEKEGLFYYNFLNKKTLKIDFFKYKEVRKIAFDETINRYWIFTYGFGIYLMDEKFNVNPFFKDDNGYLFFAHYFLKDTRGNYWIPTNNGLFKFDAFEIRNYMDNPNSILQYDYYSKKDGIINNEFNGGYFNSGIKLSNGELAFSNMEGIVVLKTLDIASKDYNYPILIDDVKHNNSSIEKKEIYNFMEDSGPIEIMLSSPFYENSSNSVLEY